MSQHPLLVRALRTAGVAVAAGVVASSAIPAQAAVGSAARVEAYMAAFPNGTKVSNNEITWEGGAVSVLLSATAKDCKAGYYCVYTDSNWRGSMARWKASASKCKKYEFTDWWRDKISSFWARGNCPAANYFLKNKKKWQPDQFQPFEGKKAYVRYNDAYDYAARGYTD
ncbi:peptidase inhibitor family I36 protein [Nonomuraea fuscirosea]|uniref:peptidase inhibitor family I36 protein n=1 Tax=Nonomuraea fuscirosea TaxID=1291556 RepID=UPI00342136D1